MAPAHPEARLRGVGVTLSPVILAGLLAASFVGGVLVAIQVGVTTTGTAIGQHAPEIDPLTLAAKPLVPAFDAVAFRAGERAQLFPAFDAAKFRAGERVPPFPTFDAIRFRDEERMPLFGR